MITVEANTEGRALSDVVADITARVPTSRAAARLHPEPGRRDGASNEIFMQMFIALG